MIVLTILAIGALLIVSALCSAIETAFTAASPAKIHKIKSDGSKFAQEGLNLIKIKDKVISTFLILYSLFNTFATTLATSLFIGLYGEEGTVISSLVMATLIIIFAEVIPKAVAVAKSELIVLISTRMVGYCLRVMHPINLALSYVVRLFCMIFKINLKPNISPAEEVRGVLQHHHVEGHMEKVDRDMIDGVLDIGHMFIEDIMIHRSKIVSISCNLPVEQLFEQALMAKHTKIPLWKDNSDNIVNVLDVKKLLLLSHKNSFNYSKIPLNEVLSEPWFIPETILVSAQLQNFKSRPGEIAFIVDEYGDLQGMVTLRDILEEIVGHIDDEKVFKSIIQVGKKYIIDGDTTVREINRELDWSLPEDDANTIAGLIINQIGRIPEKGDKLKVFDLNVTIRRKVSNKISSIILQKKETIQEDSSASKY
jgi:Mg2+/Co2+ transporter CorB